MVRYESVITAVIGGLLGTAVGLLFAFLVTQLARRPRARLRAAARAARDLPAARRRGRRDRGRRAGAARRAAAGPRGAPGGVANGKAPRQWLGPGPAERSSGSYNAAASQSIEGGSAWPENAGVCWFPEYGSRPLFWSSCAGSSSSGCWPTARTWPTRRFRSESSIRRAGSSTPAGTSRRASRSSCTTGSWSTAPRLATARTSGPTSPPTTCAVPPISSGAPWRSRVGFGWAQDDHGPPHQPLRRDRPRR